MLRTPWILITAGVLCAAVFPLDITRSVLATAASTLFEALPFLVAARLFKLPAWAGCGCGNGPAALSIPALCATWLALGPLVAIARFIAAIVMGKCIRAPHTHGKDHHENVLSDLCAIVPYGIIAGIIAHVLPALIAMPHAVSPLFALCMGSVFGFLLAPCGLGIIGIAGALHAYAPAAMLGFLCIAGICDLRTLVRLPKPHIISDRAAYMLLVAACSVVAWQHGAALVHPRFIYALLLSNIALLYLAWRSAGNAPSFQALAIPAGMFITALLGAPAPTYQATETTLAAAFPGEHLTFTGVITRTKSITALVRYAITCCRADAAPVSIRLAHDIPVPEKQWVEAHGTLELRNGVLELKVTRFTKQATPNDPFIYR